MSVSPLVLASPGLVIGDTLRDSVGVAAQLSVIAYDLEGNPVTGVQPTFVALDTGAHIENGYLIGDARVLTRVVAAVAGLQTAPETVKVTLRPDALTATDSVRHSLRAVLIDTSVTSTDLRARVEHIESGTETGVEAVIVRYEIVQAPPPASPTAGPTVLFLPGNTTATRDTSDGSGIVGRQVRLRLIAISAPQDSAIINATASYRGQSLGTVQYTVVFVKQ